MLYADIIKEFNSANIKYVIVGGIAVNLHGFVRMTADLDIMLDLESENISKTISILQNAGYKTKIPVDPMGLANVETRNDWVLNKNMKAMNFYREIEEVDIIIESPVKYNNTKKIIFDIKDIIFPVISKEDLIIMKTKSDRPQDREDIRKLKLLIKIENENLEC